MTTDADDPPRRPVTDSCGLGHDVERISCEDAARAIIANRGNPYRLRDAAVYVLRLLAAERGSRKPRVWLEGDTVPAGTRAVTVEGHARAPVNFPYPAAGPIIDVTSNRGRAGYDPAVAAERERRAAVAPPETPPAALAATEPSERRSGRSGDARGSYGAVGRERSDPETGGAQGDDDPAARLRSAADLLDRRAAAATPGPWFAYDVENWPPDDAAWVALMGPQNGPVLAAWLRREADAIERAARTAAVTGGAPWISTPTAPQALAFADAILGAPIQSEASPGPPASSARSRR